MKPIGQFSFDLTSIDKAPGTATLTLRVGVDWLNALDCD